jgi:hypothetical protein
MNVAEFNACVGGLSGRAERNENECSCEDVFHNGSWSDCALLDGIGAFVFNKTPQGAAALQVGPSRKHPGAPDVFDLQPGTFHLPKYSNS